MYLCAVWVCVHVRVCVHACVRVSCTHQFNVTGYVLFYAYPSSRESHNNDSLALHTQMKTQGDHLHKPLTSKATIHSNAIHLEHFSQRFLVCACPQAQVRPHGQVPQTVQSDVARRPGEVRILVTCAQTITSA